MTALEWEDTKWGERCSLRAGEARILLGSLGWSTRHADPKPWVLKTEIPGYKAARHLETKEEARAAADKLLASFVHHAQTALLALGEHSSNPREDG